MVELGPRRPTAAEVARHVADNATPVGGVTLGADRVRITIEYRNPRGDKLELSTQARILLQQPLHFVGCGVYRQTGAVAFAKAAA